MQKIFLLTAGILICSIGISYGVAHTSLIPYLFDFKVDSTALNHIFRANMGLYLGTGTFWLISAFRPSWRKVAIASVVFLMLGLSIGRLISLATDGTTGSVLHFYLALEIFGVVWGTLILVNIRTPKVYKDGSMPQY